MNADGILNIVGSIVTVALVTTLVSSPNTAEVINALGRAFTGSLRAAMGGAAGPGN